jgi:hypothetical protein
MSLQTNIVTSIVRSVEPERTQSATQRVTGIVQDQLAAQAVVENTKKKVQSTEKSEKPKAQKDKDPEQGQAEQHEHHQSLSYSPEGQAKTVGDDGEGHLLDVLA